MSSIDELFSDCMVVSTQDVADFFGVDVASVRAYAAEEGVDQVGNAFAWTQEWVEAAGEDLDLFDDEEDDADQDDDAGEEEDDDL